MTRISVRGFQRKKFRAKVAKERGTNWFVGVCPKLDLMVQGRTLEDAKRRMGIAIRLSQKGERNALLFINDEVLTEGIIRHLTRAWDIPREQLLRWHKNNRESSLKRQAAAEEGHIVQAELPLPAFAFDTEEPEDGDVLDAIVRARGEIPLENEGDHAEEEHPDEEEFPRKKRDRRIELVPLAEDELAPGETFVAGTACPDLSEEAVA